MAIGATAVWEIRSTGNAANGGFYDAGIGGATTDYSQQDAAQLTLTDLACSGGTAVVTSATGGFTSAMLGNGMYIASGSGFTAGFYTVSVYTSGNQISLDRSPAAGAASGGNIKIGGGQTSLVTIATSMVAGNKAYVKVGTYSWGALTTTGGSGSATVSVIGYNTTHNDNPVGANRPTITATGTFTIGTYNKIRNLIVTSTLNSAVPLNFPSTSAFGMCINCKVSNAGTAAGAIYGGQYFTAIGCECICGNGYAIQAKEAAGIINCYLHDSTSGYTTAAINTVFTGTVFDTCTTGISAGHDMIAVVNCIFYNCGTGFNRTGGALQSFINTIFHTNTTAISNNTSPGAVHENYNVFYNNGTDRSSASIDVGPNSITSDPLLTDPANGDFTISSASPAKDLGFAIQGTTGTYKLNAGVQQNLSSGGVYSGGFVG